MNWKITLNMTWRFKMTLINFTKEELYKITECINGDGDSYGDPVCEKILDKIENLNNLCDCGGKTENVSE